MQRVDPRSLLADPLREQLRVGRPYGVFVERPGDDVELEGGEPVELADQGQRLGELHQAGVAELRRHGVGQRQQ